MKFCDFFLRYRQVCLFMSFILFAILITFCKKKNKKIANETIYYELGIASFTILDPHVKTEQNALDMLNETKKTHLFSLERKKPSVDLIVIKPIGFNHKVIWENTTYNDANQLIFKIQSPEGKEQQYTLTWNCLPKDLIQKELDFDIIRYGLPYYEYIENVISFKYNTFKGLDDQQVLEKIEDIFSCDIKKDEIYGIENRSDKILTSLIVELPNLEHYLSDVKKFEASAEFLANKEKLISLYIEGEFQQQQQRLVFENVLYLTLGIFYKTSETEYSLIFKDGLVFPKVGSLSFNVHTNFETQGEPMDYMHEALPNLKRLNLHSNPKSQNILFGDHQADLLIFQNLEELYFFGNMIFGINKPVTVPTLKQLVLRDGVKFTFWDTQNLNLIFLEIEEFVLFARYPYSQASFEQLEQAVFDQVFPKVANYRIESDLGFTAEEIKKYLKLMINTSAKELSLGKIYGYTDTRILDIQQQNDISKRKRDYNYNLRYLDDNDPNYFYTHKKIETISAYHFVFEQADATLLTEMPAMEAFADKFCSFTINQGKKIRFSNLGNNAEVSKICN